MSEVTWAHRFQTIRSSNILHAASRLVLGNTFIDRILSTFASLKLRKATIKCSNIESYVNLTYSFRLGHISIRPLQVREELVQLLKLLAKLRPKLVCEIGTGGGGTLFLFSKVSSLDARIVSIDLPGGSFGGVYPEWKIPLYNSFALGRQKIHLIHGSSHNSSTVFKLKTILGQRKIDFLFIDGDHTYEGVKRDFQMYSKLVRPNGIIAFHDIVPGPPENVGGVPVFWKEVKQNFNFVEITKSWRQGGFGIGVLYV